ncbi:MAG: RsmE family RNA methyltransferase [Candidatus Hinthialibacter antarcticus]|nr:RsmE family RNA methyltransferase [Candidatus Hinthialibacter antarcticus]
MTEKIRTRLFVPSAGAPMLCLDDSDTLSVSRVLRLRRGERIDCFNGDGNCYIYAVAASQKNALSLDLEKHLHNPSDNIPETTVMISAVKGKNKDRIVRDLPPLGVTRIVFYYAERCVSRPEADQQPRLQKIAIEACRQCGRSTVPTIEIIDKPLQEAAKIDQQSVLFWENETERALRFEFTTAPMQLIFGPEGGFTDNEIDWAKQMGVQTRSLGPRILRSELAVTVGVALVQDRRGIFSAVSPHPEK